MVAIFLFFGQTLRNSVLKASGNYTLICLKEIAYPLISGEAVVRTIQNMIDINKRGKYPGPGNFERNGIILTSWNHFDSWKVTILGHVLWQERFRENMEIACKQLSNSSNQMKIGSGRGF